MFRLTCGKREVQGTALAAALVLLPAVLVAQSGAVPVNIQGQALDFFNVPPTPPVSITEVFDAASGKGAQVAFDSESGNVVLFTTDPKSELFGMFQTPGVAGDAGPVHYPWNSFYFYSSINDQGSNSGFLAGSAYMPSGYLSIQGGPPATTGILYGGSWDNMLWWDRSVESNPMDTQAPLYNWADLVPGDVHACTPLPAAAAPHGRFVVLSQRHGCDYLLRTKNIESAGAIAWVIYDDQETDNLESLTTAGSSIPVVLIRAKDGAAIIDYLHQSGAAATVVLHPTNLQAFISGSYKVGPDGNLQGVNLNLMIATAFDIVFSGTLSTQ